ncbi:MAG: hypothetical protein CPSOU_3427 [uncultured Paraburkholderia sp.]|nr:MAG: hypothetical protein CPSOU_3427 [uncultured Paraburkholderia sp.]
MTIPRALRHGDMHRSDNGTDLHDVSPFSHSRLYGFVPVKVMIKAPLRGNVAYAPRLLRVNTRESYESLFPFCGAL